MQRFRYLLSNITVMNLLLAAIMVLFIRYMASPILTDIKNSPFAPKKTAAQGSFKKEKSENNDKSPSPSDYMIIAEQNLFHPQRIIPAPKPEVPPLPKPEFVLYGTLVTDSVQIAYMDDKKSEDKKNRGAQAKKQTALRLGDSLSGFVLKQVDKDQVMMQRGEEKISVYLSDVKLREASAATAAAAAPPASVQKAGNAPQVPGMPAGPRRTRRLRSASSDDD